jgi:hypothetical protein
VPFGCPSELADCNIRRASLPSAHLSLVDGTVVTAPARTVLDVARHAPLRTAVAAMDAALHSALVTPSDLSEVLLHCATWPGARSAQRALRLADGRAESPLESISRLMIADLGVPPAELQVVIHDKSGRFVARLDAYWDDVGVGGEADGGGKYDDRSILLAEKSRQEQLERTGLVVVRWDWETVWRRPWLLRERLLAAFRRGRARDQAGIPRAWHATPCPTTGLVL